MNKGIFSLIAAILLSPNAMVGSIEVLGADATKRLNQPFSEAVVVGDLMFVSGQIGTKPGELKLVEGGVQAETRQARSWISSYFG